MESWKIIQNEFSKEDNLKFESIFTTANGYLGMRGDMEESYEDLSSARNLLLKDTQPAVSTLPTVDTQPALCTLPGNYVNGFYEVEDIAYHERGHGYANHDQTMLNLCHPRRWTITVDGEVFRPLWKEPGSFYREMDMQKGLLTRKMKLSTSKGKQVEIIVQRMACLARPSTAVVRYSVTPLDFNSCVEITLFTDIMQSGRLNENDPRIHSNGNCLLKLETFQLLKDRMTYLSQCTKRSGFRINMAAVDQLACGSLIEEKTYTGTSVLGHTYKFSAEQGQEIVLDRFICFTSSQSIKDSLEETCRTECLNARACGFSALLSEQEEYLRSFWSFCDIEIDGPVEIQQAIRFNLFQLLQSTGRDTYTSIAAKGLTGDGYKGHYFWESEAYILPVFLCSIPQISRAMLIYRHRILPQARRQARLLGHRKGALYSWRSINGEECSAYYPAGSAQYHINADIAFAVKRYVEATEDMDFLLDYGAEIVLETARLWADTGHFSPAKNGLFCIHSVTGPDEYTALVDNNCYTNIMARENTAYATEVAELLRLNYPERWGSLCEKIRLEKEEIALFTQIAENMYIPYDEGLKIHKQDDTFLDKKVLDLSTVSSENRPLLLHYHPLFIYRHQVCKQPDLILAQLLTGHHFSCEQKQRDFDYYEKVTIHDSSLSASIFSIMASEIGYRKKAYDYFVETARMDLDDTHNNTRFGLHMANMAGTWAAVVNGFGGMRMDNGTLKFNPYLPDCWKAYSFQVYYRDSLIRVAVNREGVSYRLISGERVEFVHSDQKTVLSTEAQKCFPHHPGIG